MLNLIGIVLPALIDLVNSKIADSKARFWVSALICSVFGVIINFIQHNGLGGYSSMTMLMVVDSLAESALAMFGVAQISYKALWEKSDMRDAMSLNARTNGTDDSSHV